MAGELHKIISWSFWTANLVSNSCMRVSRSRRGDALLQVQHSRACLSRTAPMSELALQHQHQQQAPQSLTTQLCLMQLIDAVYVIMAWATATNLANASGNLHIATWKDAQSTVRSFISNNIWRAPIAACALGGLMVVLFNLMSCIVLLRCADSSVQTCKVARATAWHACQCLQSVLHINSATC